MQPIPFAMHRYGSPSMPLPKIVFVRVTMEDEIEAPVPSEVWAYEEPPHLQVAEGTKQNGQRFRKCCNATNEEITTLVISNEHGANKLERP